MAAREEEEAHAANEELCDFRSKLKEALNQVSCLGMTPCHGGELSLKDHGHDCMIALSVKGLGKIGLPLCNERAASLLQQGCALGENTSGSVATLIEGYKIELNASLQALLDRAAKGGMRHLHLDLDEVRVFSSKVIHTSKSKEFGMSSSSTGLVVNSLIVMESGVPSIALNKVAQNDRSYGRMVVQLPSFYGSTGTASLTVTHNETAKTFNWGGPASDERLFHVVTFSQCAIDLLSPQMVPGQTGRGLFLVCDIVRTTPGPLPCIADNSKVAETVRTAIRGMLSDKDCEKLAVPLNTSMRYTIESPYLPHFMDRLCASDKALVALLQEEPKLAVGFAGDCTHTRLIRRARADTNSVTFSLLRKHTHLSSLFAFSSVRVSVSQT